MTRVNELASVGWTIALGELPPVGLPPLEAMTEAMAFSRPFLGSSTVSRSAYFMPLLGGSQGLRNRTSRDRRSTRLSQHRLDLPQKI